ncbi:MAG: phosphoribosylglycinamide synthetase [Bacteroidetes bacterium]|nr:MAG: phosphoribosylglycinamide synthetase [Bacteroidota bacterium]
MNYIHFSPYFPPNYSQFSVALKESGALVLGLGDTPYDLLIPELKSALTEYYKVDDLHNYDQLVRAVGYFTHKYGKIDGLDAHNEYWLETEAQLRTDFNIKGIKTDKLSSIKKKSEMKQIFIKAGLAVARGKVLHNLIDAQLFIAETGYPVVAKPDSGVGAANTYKIENEHDLFRFFDNQPNIDYIFEEFIEGTIYSFDGLVDQNGQLLYYNAMRNESGVMEVVNDDMHIYILTLKDIPSDLEEAGKAVIKAFDLKGRFFHFEFFRQPNGKLVALEVNMRPPGGFTTDMWNFASNINIYKIWAEMVVNNRTDLHYTRQYHVCFVGRKLKYAYKNSVEEVVEKYAEYIPFHDKLDKALSRAMGDYCFLVRAEDEAKVMEIQKFIHQFS